MDLKSYAGKIIYVDLSNKNIREEDLNKDYARDFLGGAGLAARYLYDLVDETTDPLSPENPLIFMTGPLSGTTAPFSGRYVAAGLSPLTNIWGESIAGGEMGNELKFAGYDGLIISGKAEEWSFLYITPDKIEIQDANHLVGKNVSATYKALSELVQVPKLESVIIGRAGENLVKYATIMNMPGFRAFGRTGLGALMGSKNLKAIATRAPKRKIPVADDEQLKDLTREVNRYFQEDQGAQILNEMGTSNIIDMNQEMWGSMANKYFSQGFFDTAAISGATMAETILTGTGYCYACPIGCHRKIEIKDGKYKLPETKGPEYETLASFGSDLLINNLKGISYAANLADELGLDTISAGVSIGFAYHLFEKGIITTKDTDGIELKWGDPDLLIDLLKLISERRGIGEIIAEGTQKMAVHFNVSPEEAAEVKGLEIPFHDARAFFGMGVSYATSERGACHNRADFFMVEYGYEMNDIDINVKVDRFDNETQGEQVAKFQNVRQLTNSMLQCILGIRPFQTMMDLIKYSTGMDLSLEDGLKMGERIFNLKRIISNKRGITREDDRLPEIALRPLEEGGTEGNVPKMDLILKEYYAYRGWDWETGRPTKEKLEELGLDKLAI